LHTHPALVMSDEETKTLPKALNNS